MNEIIVIAIVSSIGVLTVAVSGYVTYRAFKRKTLHEEVLLWVASYRSRLTGENRFLLNENVLMSAFHEYPKEDVMNVWVKLTKDHVVTKDPLDNEWCIR